MLRAAPRCPAGRRWCSGHVAALLADGVAFVDRKADHALVEAARVKAVAAYEECLALARARQNGAALAVGTNYGWREVVQRARGRYDVTFNVAAIEEVAALEALYTEAVAAVFAGCAGGRYQKIGQGVLVTEEGADAHPPHIDGPHLFPADAAPHLPPHAVNLFVPLVDLDLHNGATEFLLGSHRDTNVPPGRGFADLVADPGRYRRRSTAGEVSRGAGVLFDYRVLHNAAPHTAGPQRPVLYFTYAAPWFSDVHNFPERSLHTPMAALC